MSRHGFYDSSKTRHKKQDRIESIYLSTTELIEAETYWFLLTQQQTFPEEVDALIRGDSLPNSSCLFSLHPFVDSSGLLRVGGWGRNTEMSYSVIHPVILPRKHPITSLLISSEHRRLMHAGPTTSRSITQPTTLHH